MTTKVCKQCGELKPLEQYRKYYGGRKGSYNTCKLCEKINSREKYLAGKEAAGTLTETEHDELYKIYELWEHQMTLGLRPPRFSRGKSTPLAESLDDMVGKYAARAKATVGIVATDAQAPAELLKWLTEELTEEPEYYQEEIYDALQKKYRPQLRIDTATMLPVHDDTHRNLLQKILARFDEYEDGYYDKD
jgi:hypothetical protein